MSGFPPAPAPKSRLGRYRLLAPTAAVRVSPLCLGAMNFGEGWKERLGECDKENSFKMLDTFYENGGNFIDTANNYQCEDSESWLGEWMEKRGVRDQIVLATKYTSGYRTYKPEIQANFVGNNTKSMRVSVNASLKKLRTDYIDLLYVHWWDFSTSIEEVMTSLNQLVTAGKVLYLGVSDTPAWVVSRANQYARDHGMRPFSVYQGQWNAARRDFERDIIPMCAAEGMGICPWGSIGGGAFKTAAHRAELAKNGNPGRQVEPRDVDVAVSAVLERVAARHNTVITSVALAYVMSKAPHVAPIVGGRKVEQLLGNIEALKLELSDEDVAEIEGAYEFDPGFPSNFLFRGEKKESHPGNIVFLNAAARFDYVDLVRPIKPKDVDA
ncbi:Norsolorinic acid reductase B [Penicillium macrosclerotiorum]|uniref:Norsolorinic acid reductase B n=1 Tax=Penicillium macrosclerotiorum TaxID=303699 RepID=UPI0025496780|nr:Norsolorinic acid reductase B [Penicillium macrosclerotiorum]KAJ5683031.1 Norsolorinic acid reductase B [Penicillium macrosclerotiorum]